MAVVTDLAELAKLGKEPLPAGADPSGLQYDPDFESLRVQVQKLEAVIPEPVDWGRVVEGGTTILRERGKHLLIAAYLTVGLLEKEGYHGLATGLGIIRDLLAYSWESLEPPLARRRGRMEAINWLAERGGKAAEARPPDGGEQEALQTCSNLVIEIGKALGERFGADAPGLGELDRVLRQHVANTAAAAKAAEAKRQQAARIAAGEVDAQTTPNDARKVLTKTFATVRQISEILRRANSSDPLPYRLLRVSAWAAAKDLPAQTNGVTQVPAPPAEMTARLAELAAKADPKALVEAAETALPNAPFWLDLQRWSAQGLAALGSTHELALSAVLSETASLLARLPGLADLNFAGGVPFAGTETRKWIESDVRPHQAGSAAGAPPPESASLPAGLTEAAQEARSLIARGQLPAALRRMQSGAAGAATNRDGFLWRLELARICLDAGQALLAVPLLEELEGQIETHRLEIWEPPLCVAVYTPLLTARRVLLKDPRRATPELAQKTSQLHDRLCRLDPALALSLEGK